MFKTSIIPLALAIAAGNAFADTVTVEDLEKRIDQLERELIDVQDSAGTSGDGVKFKKSAPSPKLFSRDGRSALEFKGRVETDYVNSSSKTVNGGGELETQDSYSAAQINRLRVGLEGVFARDWEYEIQFDFADNINDEGEKLDLKDANIVYEGFENHKLTFGYQKYAFGLENTQSSRHGYLMHRAYTDAFSPDRNFGIQHRYDSDNWAIRTSYAFENKDDEFNTMFGTRVVGAPIKGEYLLHLGASYLYTAGDIDDDQAEARYRVRPSAKPSDRILNTDKFASDHQHAFGAEFAVQRNNLLIQGEYAHMAADNVDFDDTTNIDAAYLSAIYTLTGETWEYRRKNGTFRQVTPANPVSAGGWGAWEIAARIQTANFDDEATEVYGGKTTDLAIGVNWYLEKHLKAQFNYIYGENKYHEAIHNPDVLDDSYQIVQARLQFSF